MDILNVDKAEGVSKWAMVGVTVGGREGTGDVVLVMDGVICGAGVSDGMGAGVAVGTPVKPGNVQATRIVKIAKSIPSTWTLLFDFLIPTSRKKFSCDSLRIIIFNIEIISTPQFPRIYLYLG
jgi:hypothetical protein